MSLNLNERGRRVFAASEALAAGDGGIAAVSRATEIALSTIVRGPRRVRRHGRVGHVPHSLSRRRPQAVGAYGWLGDGRPVVACAPGERGGPMSPLHWTCKSLHRLAAELGERRHQISHTVVGELLKRCNFSLQANRKTREIDHHPDRDAQFDYINRCVSASLEARQPVISIDTKKKELVGDVKNGGREWRAQGTPKEVRVHDFLIKERGRAVS